VLTSTSRCARSQLHSLHVFAIAPGRATLTYKERKEMTYEEYLASRIRHDKFAAIKYQRPRGDYSGTRGLQLTERNFALQWVVEKSWDHFIVSVPTCWRLNRITAKTLFDDAETWDRYGPGVQHAFGHCLTYFVEKKMLPLSCINIGHSGARVYGPLEMEEVLCL